MKQSALAFFVVCLLILPVAATPTISGGLPSWSILNVSTTATFVNNSYVLLSNGSYVKVSNASYLLVDGSRAMAGNLLMGGNAIQNLLDPVNLQDAMTLNYADTNYAATSDLTDYYLRDTTRSLTGTSIYRDVTNDVLSVYGSTDANPYGAALHLYGEDAIAQSGGAIFSVGNAAGDAGVPVWSVLGRTDTPYLDLNSHQIKALLDPTNNQDAVTLAYYNAHMAGGGGGLSDAWNTSYQLVSNNTNFFYKPGVDGGQWANGGTQATDNLYLNGTISDTKSPGGNIIMNRYGGNVGIGIPDPQHLLTINGSYPLLAIQDFDLDLKTRMTDRSVGGISFYAIEGGIAQQFAGLYGWFDYISSTEAYKILDVFSDARYIGHKTNGSIIRFLTTTGLNSNIAMVINQTKVGIGTETPGITTIPLMLNGQLHVKSTNAGLMLEGSSQSQIELLDTGTSANDRIYQVVFNNGNLIFRGVADAGGVETTALTISHNGNIKIDTFGAGTVMTDASGNLYVVSDEKYKTDIKSYTTGLSATMNTTPDTFKFTSDSGLDTTNTYLGFIAEKLQQSIPEAVYSKPDVTYQTIDNKTVEVPVLDKDGKQTVTLSISDRAILAVAINAIKEQQVIINNQQLQIDNLTRRVEALEKKVGM